MPRILSIKNYSSENLGGNSTRWTDDVSQKSCVWDINHRAKAKTGRFSSRGSVKIGLASVGFILAAVILVGGAFYLYQVNDLATKGYEIKDLEKKIENLRKDNEGYKIREVELKSMYNIEKSTEDLDLVNSQDISYLEINGSVAISPVKDWTK